MQKKPLIKKESDKIDNNVKKARGKQINYKKIEIEHKCCNDECDDVECHGCDGHDDVECDGDNIITEKTRDYINKAKIVHGNKYDYSKVDFINRDTNITVICKTHGEFVVSPRIHIEGKDGKDCKQCVREINEIKRVKEMLSFIEKSNKIHKNKYNYSKVNYINDYSKVIIICEDHGEYEMAPRFHVIGRGCKKCKIIEESNKTPNKMDENIIVNDIILDKIRITSTEEFIRIANLIHKNKYKYEKTIYVYNKEKVIITCPSHGDFEQLPSNHLKTSGCNKCGIESRANKCRGTVDDFISKAMKINGDRYDYSLVKYLDTSTPVTIICRKHGKFQQTPAAHLSNNQCAKCSGRYRYTTEEWVAEAMKIHNNKYDYSKVVYINNDTKVKIICKSHGEFEKYPHHHLSKTQGCLICDGIKHTTETFIDDCNKVHNNKYDYSEVNYIDSKTNVIVKCDEHGIFTIRPSHHKAGQECPICTRIKRSNANIFVEQAIAIHGDKYNYNNFKYVNSKIKGEIKCNVDKSHGVFMQLPGDHIYNKSGCPKCANDLNSVRKTLTNSEFIERANKVHNNIYDYSLVNYVGTDIKITIKCPKHYKEFTVTPSSHLQGNGRCPKCSCCPSCLLWRTGGTLCSYCDPVNATKKNQKPKEMAVVRFLKDNLPDNEFVHNQSVSNACTGTHLFPDILFDCGWYYLIIEVDEFQHRGGDYSCDKKRMHDIIAKLGLPCIFIRYNPDSKKVGNKSNKNVLLSKVKEYLDLSEDTQIWDDFGFKVDYLFYNNKK